MRKAYSASLLLVALAAPLRADPPVAYDQSASSVQGSYRDGIALSYASVCDYTQVEFTLISPPLHGTLEVMPARYSYSPLSAGVPVLSANWCYTATNCAFVGTDSFSWTVRNADGLSSTATCSVVLGANTRPTASSSAYSCAVNSLAKDLKTYAMNRADADGSKQQHYYKVDAVPTHGTLVYWGAIVTNNALWLEGGGFYYTPDPGYIGTDSFTWRYYDRVDYSLPSTVPITVTANTVPVANNKTQTVVTASVRVMVSMTTVADNNDYQAYAKAVYVAPTNGVLEYSSNLVSYFAMPTGTFLTTSCNWFYTPTPGFVGTDSVVWAVSDGMATSGLARLTIAVTTNTIPSCTNIGVSIVPATVRNPIAIRYTDPDANQWRRLILKSMPAGGALEKYAFSSFTPIALGEEVDASSSPTTIYYTPSPAFTGTDTFWWAVSDGISTSIMRCCTLSIGTNCVPVALDSHRYGLVQGHSLAVTLPYIHAAQDAAQPLSYRLEREPAHGAVVVGVRLHAGDVVSQGTWTYVADGAYAGPDDFAWSISDQASTSASAVVAFNVSALQPPVAQPAFLAGTNLLDGTRLLQVGGVASPELVDWNNDGLLDLVVGQSDGRIVLYLNQGTRGRPIFTGGRYLKLASGKEIRSYRGGCTCFGGNLECPAPRMFDWDHDGRKDLLVGEWNRDAGLFVYLNVGTDAAPQFDRKVACDLYDATGYSYATTQPFVTDWDDDGIGDIVSGLNAPWGGAYGGTAVDTINVYLGSRVDHQSARVQSMWVNAEVYNWNQARMADCFVSIRPTLTFAGICPVGSRKSVVVADWTGRGVQDLMTGMQDGTIWFSPNVGSRQVPVYTNCTRLQAGGANIVIGAASKVGTDSAYNKVQYMTSASTYPTINEARLAVGDLDGDGLPDLVAGDASGYVTVFYQSNAVPVAIDQKVVALPGGAKPVTLSARVDSRRSAAYAVQAGPQHGTLTGSAPALVYLPDSGFTGADSFTFVASDGASTSRCGTISITVQGHAPAADWRSPVTATPTVVMNMNTSVVLTLAAADDCGEPLTYRVDVDPQHGMCAVSSNTITYTPAPGYAGADSLCYRANNGWRDSQQGTIALDVCTLAVNFQPAASAVLQGYRADTGATNEPSRGYGWDVAASAWQRNVNADPRLDTLVTTSGQATWSASLPNGAYYVSLAMGDPSAYRSAQWSLQGVTIVSNKLLSGGSYFITSNVPAMVSDGVLRIGISAYAGYHGALNAVVVRPASRASGAATFVREDTTTQGAWRGVYGADGYDMVVGDLLEACPDTTTAILFPDAMVMDVPSHLAFSGPPKTVYPNPRNFAVWSYPTNDPRALQYPRKDTRVAAYWSTSPVNFDLAYLDGQTHRVALYCMAWGNAAWTQRVDVLDADCDAVLDSRLVTDFGSGKWLVWDLRGHVKIRVTCISGSVAVGGIFFGEQAAPRIGWQPLDQQVRVGQVACFRVRAEGIPLNYQWQRLVGGSTWVNLSGATGEIWSVTAAAEDDGARFRCAISNACGAVVSDAAALATTAQLPKPPRITSPLRVTAVLNAPFAYVVAASNRPTGFDASLPPSGYGCGAVTMDRQTGLISATAMAALRGHNDHTDYEAGPVLIPISASNDGGVDEQVLTVIVNPVNAPVVTSALAATATVGVAFSYTITGASNPVSYTARGLPSGFALVPGSGTITGTAALASCGTVNVEIGAANGYGTGLARLVLTIASAVDAHGIPDSWKFQYFGTTSGVGTGALEDWDHDGVSNLHEYLAGTDPASAQSRLQLVAAEPEAGTNIVLWWSSVDGKRYAIESGTNLVEGLSELLEHGVDATPDVNCRTVRVNQAAARFFRVRLEE